jgi:hypothetical protein
VLSERGIAVGRQFFERLANHNTSGPRGYPPTLVELDHALVARLRPEAARRDVRVVRLIHGLLDVIATDQLTGAILDDGTTSTEA